MSKVEEIEKEVQGLKPEELQAFRQWFWNFDAEAWDRQFEKDALSEKLDSLAEVALKSFKSGDVLYGQKTRVSHSMQRPVRATRR